MNEWLPQTQTEYERKGLGGRVGWGERPALVVVDFAKAFTDPQVSIGTDYSSELSATAQLLQAFRAGGFPVVYMTVAYRDDLSDAGTFIKKVPSLSVLVQGSELVEIDERIKPVAGEEVVTKKFASAFFGTPVAENLKAQGVDTVVLAGCTTRGCIRASAIDSMQYEFRTIVVEEAVGDRAAGPHEANLFDIDSKYADVVSLESALKALADLTAQAAE